MRKAVDWEQVKARLKNTELAIAKSTSAGPERLTAVYRERAARLAQQRSTVDEDSSGLQVLCFMLGTARYALELSEIAEVLPMAGYTSVPGADAALFGVFNLRGEIIPIMELSRILELPTEAQAACGYIILLQRAGLEVGLKVDQVSGIKRFELKELSSASAPAGEHSKLYCKKITQDAVQILDAEALLAHEAFSVN